MLSTQPYKLTKKPYTWLLVKYGTRNIVCNLFRGAEHLSQPTQITSHGFRHSVIVNSELHLGKNYTKNTTSNNWSTEVSSRDSLFKTRQIYKHHNVVRVSCMQVTTCHSAITNILNITQHQSITKGKQSNSNGPTIFPQSPSVNQLQTIFTL